MSCFKPLTAWRSKDTNPSGKRPLVFRADLGEDGTELQIPCGRCIGCRLDRSREWAIRCVHEAQMHERNCFITLTYNDEHLPEDRSVHVEDFQKFMKRLRKKFVPKNPHPKGSDARASFARQHGVRFFHCGEYGEQGHRPHYHACLFNFDFPDRELFSERDGVRLYTSQMLQDLWSDAKGDPIGFVTVGDVTFDSAAYVARYIMKKISGEDAEDHYSYIDETTGEYFQRNAEYVTMSRRPGIGKYWYDDFGADVYPHDYVVHDNHKIKPPRFYDGLYEISGGDLDFVKQKREEAAQKLAQEPVLVRGANGQLKTNDRLAVKEKVKLSQINQLKRTLS